MSASGAIFLDVEELLNNNYSKQEIVEIISDQYDVSETYVNSLIESVLRESE